MRFERPVWETARLSWIAVTQKTQYLSREIYLRTLYLRQIRAYLPSLEALARGTEYDAKCTNGNVVVPWFRSYDKRRHFVFQFLRFKGRSKSVEGVSFILLRKV